MSLGQDLVLMGCDDGGSGCAAFFRLDHLLPMMDDAPGRTLIQ